ncbi:MAG: BREX-6 system adenine-specific DNA-methyltransferase PglX [Vulcanimicrobiota bacterium]
MMTSAAKNWLKKTVRELRERLLTDIRAQVDSSYKLALKRADAVLTEEQRKKRVRLEEWLEEQVRAGSRGVKEKDEQARERHLSEAIKLAAATFLNRLVVVRQMETLGLLRSKVLMGGWSSPGYKDFRDFAPEIRHLEGEGFPFLMQLIFDELSLELPGLFGPVGLEEFLPISVAMWRDAVKTLEAKEELSEEDRRGLWQDDTLLGWVYQFWNDPDLDELRARKGKIENHELAAKTQLFTDRYIVEWLCQNSIGQIWFNICAKNGWTPEAVESKTLENLETRRATHRALREQGKVSMEALVPIENEKEEHWKYWVPRDLAQGDLQNTPVSLRDLKLLDPACGSGHFLVYSFELLAALYEEEARHQDTSWSAEQISKWILEENLHGMDIDGRAVQVAAAALWLKMKRYSPEAEARPNNLVSTDLKLRALSDDDPAIKSFVASLEDESGIPGPLLEAIVTGLRDADHLGSLLRLEKLLTKAAKSVEGTFFAQTDVREFLVQKLTEFVQSHADDAELNARLRGEGLARCADFLRLNKEEYYDLVIGNPPYLQSSDIPGIKLDKSYPDGKSDLYGAFLLRSLEFVKRGGLSALVTMRGWMFLKTFRKLRGSLLKKNYLQLLGDLNHGCFDTIPGVHVATVMTLFRRGAMKNGKSVAVMPTPLEDYQQDNRRTYRKRAALLAGVGLHEFRAEDLKVVPEQPLVYWWSDEFLEDYVANPKFVDINPARTGANTGDNARFLRYPWETNWESLALERSFKKRTIAAQWYPFIKGAAGTVWFEPVSFIVNWLNLGLEMKVNVIKKFGPDTVGWKIAHESSYFTPGIAFAMVGAAFTARLHRFASVFGNMGSSVFPRDEMNTVCLMNSQRGKFILNSLNPGVHYEVGDVNRLPLFPIESANEIVAQLDDAFTAHEQARETSVEFLQPGKSAWTYAQEWAQRAVDRRPGERLPPYEPVYEDPAPEDRFSFAVGLALGRFLPPDKISADPNEPSARPVSAIADAGKDDLSHALPHGILFLAEHGDSLDHPAAKPILELWEADPIARGDVRDYLKNKFFNDIHNHKDRYRPRPIYFPLSSAKRTYVAFISIHRWTDNTLEHLLADYLQPELNRLSGELNDLADARTKGDVKQQSQAQKRYEQILELSQELQDFANQVRDIAERGAPPVDKKCPPREVDAPFKMNLDDGVMINSAALWPLLEPQWKDPKKWWTELCQSKGKDYDWAHLAKRYFPSRVDQKCQQDPSLAVAHGCFWKYHPEKAYEWELRLQDPEELGPSFTLDEENSNELRAQFEAKHPDKAREIRESEEKRRAKNAAKAEKEKVAAEGQLELGI